MGGTSLLFLGEEGGGTRIVATARSGIPCWLGDCCTLWDIGWYIVGFWNLHYVLPFG